jgi:hypothetical protein
MRMRVGNSPSLVIDNDLLENFDFEGMLIRPSDARFGMLVMSSKDSTFTLHIYKLRLQNKKFEYHIDKELTTKTFTTLTEMQFFLNTFSIFKEDDFTDFLQKYDK